MTLSNAIIDRILQLQNERKITTNKLATLSGLAQPTVRDVVHGVSKAPKINRQKGDTLGCGKFYHSVPNNVPI